MTVQHAMSTADAAWLHMDRPTNLMVINSVLLLEQPLDRDTLRDLFVERVVDRFPRYSQRIVESGVRRTPHWADDEHFDPDLHVHHLALPAPHDEKALQELVADLIATPLDPTKPLWHLHLIDNVDSGCAVLVRMHHCIADGITLARVMLEMVDEAAAAGFTESRHEHGGGGLRRLVPGPVAAAASGALAAASGARAVAGRLAHEGMETLVRPGHLAELARDATRDAQTLAKVLIGPPDRKTALRGSLGVAHRVAWSDPLDLDRVKAVGHRAGATVNDVLVTSLAGALGGYLEARDDGAADEVHAFVPFNLRPLDQPIPRDLGNRFGLVLLGLPVGEADPGARLRATKTAMDAIKSSPEGPFSYGVLEALGVAPPAVEARVVDIFTSRASMVLTNVPGPREPVSLAGRPIARVLVWAPCSGSVGMSVSIFSYRGEVTIGLMVDAGLVPEPGAITGAVGAELEALERAVTGGDGRGTSRSEA